MEAVTFKLKRPSLGQAINGSLMMLVVFFIISGMLIKALMGMVGDPFTIGVSFGLGATIGFQWSYWKYFLHTLSEITIHHDGFQFGKEHVNFESLEDLWEDFPRAIHIRHLGRVFHIHPREGTLEAFDDFMGTVRKYARARQLQVEGQISSADGILARLKTNGTTATTTHGNNSHNRADIREMLQIMIAWVFCLPIIILTILSSTLWTQVQLTQYSEQIIGRTLMAGGIAVLFHWAYLFLAKKKILLRKKLVGALLVILWLQVSLVTLLGYRTHRYISTHMAEFKIDSNPQGRSIANQGENARVITSNGRVQAITFDRDKDGNVDGNVTPDGTLQYREKNYGGSLNIGGME